MKIAIGFIVLLVLIGVLYGLGRAHILPLQGVAKSSPALGKLLAQLKLITPPKLKPPVLQTTAPVQVDPLASEKAQIASEQAQIDQEKQSLAAKPAPVISVAQTEPQLVAIYEAMNSDDLAALFTKQPDSAVVSALIGMDTKKAAKALAAMPPERAAKITAQMNQSMAAAASLPQPPAT